MNVRTPPTPVSKAGLQMDQTLVLNNLSTAVLALDHELRLCYINQAAEGLFGISGKKAIGHAVADLVAGFREVEPILFDALQTGQTFTQRKGEFVAASGAPVTADYTISPIAEDEWPRLLIEMHPLDRYLRIDRDAALSEHQEVTRQMLRGLAHEIKNPLGGIRGSAQLLQSELADPAFEEYTRVIIDETDRLAGLVDRLLGPNSPPKFACGNIHEVIEKVRLLIAAEFEHRITVIRDYDPSIPEVLMDAEMMMQAILNIARNAAQSMAATPQPRLRLVTRTERQFTISSVRHRLLLRIDISDNGPGIPPALREHLFYPMISGRADGTGLGLSVAHSIVHRHRGIIEFSSEPGCTTFTLFIPLETDHAQ